MSSRILRGEPVAAVRTLAWRSVQQVATSFHGASAESALADKPQSSRHSDAEWESRVRAAFEQGLSEGRGVANSIAIARAQEAVKPILESFRNLLDELSRTKAKLRAEAEEDVVKLALAVARRILHRELATDAEALLGLVRSAWDRVDARETQRLRLSPDDAAVIQSHREALNLPPKVEISADASLARGSAIFETTRGNLDASVGTQLGEIERGFVDVLKRHRGGLDREHRPGASIR